MICNVFIDSLVDHLGGKSSFSFFIWIALSMQENSWQRGLLNDRFAHPAARQQALLFEFFCCLLNERLLVVRQVLKVDLKDGVVVFQVDYCG